MARRGMPTEIDNGTIGVYDDLGNRVGFWVQPGDGSNEYWYQNTVGNVFKTNPSQWLNGRLSLRYLGTHGTIHDFQVQYWAELQAGQARRLTDQTVQSLSWGQYPQLEVARPRPKPRPRPKARPRRKKR